MKINNYVWENDLSLNDLVLKQKERIEYLERSNNRREDEILGLRQENADLDNIINELEKWLNKEIKRLDEMQDTYDKYGKKKDANIIYISGAYNEVLDKIQELKGDGSNDNQRKTT